MVKPKDRRRVLNKAKEEDNNKIKANKDKANNNLSNSLRPRMKRSLYQAQERLASLMLPR